MKKLLIPKTTLWLFLSISAICTGIGLFLTTNSLMLIGAWQVIGLILYASVWMILLIDLIENSPHCESLWIAFFLFLPFLASVPYLAFRDRIVNSKKPAEARFSPFMHDEKGWENRLN